MTYFNYKYHELISLDAPTYDYLVQIMNHAQANEHLELKELISYPHLKSQDQNNLNRKLIMKASSEKMRAKEAVTTDQLSMAGISVGNIADYVKGN